MNKRENIIITIGEGVTEAETNAAIEQEIAIWDKQKRMLASIEICIDGDELIIKTKEKSPIKRYRRITGYCVELTNMSSWKQSEVADRKSHI